MVDFSAIWYSDECDVLMRELRRFRKNYGDWYKIIREKQYLDALAVWRENHHERVRIQYELKELEQKNQNTKILIIEQLDDEVKRVRKALQEAESLEDYDYKKDLCQAIQNYLVKVENVRYDYVV